MKAFTHYMGIGSKGPLPKIMGDDGDIVVAGGAFFRKECSSKFGLHAKDGEEIGVAEHDPNHVWVLVRLCDSSGSLSQKSDIGERSSTLVPILFVACVGLNIRASPLPDISPLPR
jgi:hypothetical protein